MKLFNRTPEVEDVPRNNLNNVLNALERDVDRLRDIEASLVSRIRRDTDELDGVQKALLALGEAWGKLLPSEPPMDDDFAFSAPVATPLISTVVTVDHDDAMATRIAEEVRRSVLEPFKV